MVDIFATKEQECLRSFMTSFLLRKELSFEDPPLSIILGLSKQNLDILNDILTFP